MIRQAHISDIEKIARLEKKYIECAWSGSMLSDAFEDNSYVFLIDEEKDLITGYIFFKKILDEAEICNIAVDKNFQRQGRAKQLILAVENYAKENDIKKLFLEVNENNFAAIKLYEKCGYVFLISRKNYYAGGGSAIVMSKNL